MTRLLKFLILSVLIHLIIISWGEITKRTAKVTPRTQVKKRIELQVEKKVDTKAKTEVSRARKPDGNTADAVAAKEGPVRLRPNEERIENNQQLVSRDKPEQQPKTVTEPDPREKKLPPVEKQKSLEKNLPAQKRSTEQEQTAIERELVKTRFKSRQEYENYRESMEIANVKGLPVPELEVIYKDADEVIAAGRYFGLRLVIYADTGTDGQPVMIEVEDPNVPTFRLCENFDKNSYSNRVREKRDNPFFDNLRERAISEFGLEGKQAYLISLIPNNADLYFRYKQIECAKRNGINPFSVKVTYARYHPTDIGVWILAVERMKLRDGRIVPVEDFELEEIGA